jgi:hypothetical protein
MTFFPFVARRRAAMDASSPRVSDTLKRVQISCGDRVCQVTLEISARVNWVVYNTICQSD